MTQGTFKIICDREKAAKETEKFIKEHNRICAGLYNPLMWCFAIGISAVIIGVWGYDSMCWIAGIPFILFGVFIVLFEVCDRKFNKNKRIKKIESSAKRRKCEPLILYYIATKDFPVLKVEKKINNEYVDLYVYVEEENGYVKKNFAGTLKKQFCMSVTEETADINNGLYLIPFHKEEVKIER